MTDHHAGVHPETAALGKGYIPSLSVNSAKTPCYLTSTFCFNKAEEGKRFFRLAYGLDQPKDGEEMGLIYSRVGNPNLEIFEERMAAYDQTEDSAVFAAGMAAISTTCMAICNPGDHIISTRPVYGGTDYLFEKVLPKFNITVHFTPSGPGADKAILEKAQEIGCDKVKLIYVETPANPSLAMTDIAAVHEARLQINKDTVLMVDNTFLGPIFQTPVKHGADLIVASATKFIGGHSDVVGGVVSGSKALLAGIKGFRTILGTMAGAFDSWLLLRSLETVKIRMKAQAETACKVAAALVAHPNVERVTHPSLFKDEDENAKIWKKQCTGTGSMISFVIKGGEEAAFKWLDSVRIPKLAVSLGGTETLVEHPMRMTHADVPPEELRLHGVVDGLVRISIGLENEEDLISDLIRALDEL